MADNIVFTNNASALLAADISTTIQTSVQVAAGFGALFPAPSAPEVCYITVEDDSGNIEVMQVTSRAADVLTVVRAQDGTTALTFTASQARVELRLVKIVMQEFLQKNGGTMTGNVDFNGNSIVDAVLSGASTQITAGEIVGVPLRSAAGVDSNQIAVPAAPGRATVGGAAILASGDDIVAELDIAGIITLNSATTGVVMDQADAYFRMLGPLRVGDDATHYGEMQHNGTDMLWAFAITDDLVVSGLTNGVIMNELELSGPVFLDFSLKQQTVAATATLDIDVSLGNYVTITMGTSIVALSFSGVPSTGVTPVRLKFVQDVTGGKTCDFTGIQWAGGSDPVLTTDGDAVDFVDIWYDGGTWYGSFNYNWS